MGKALLTSLTGRDRSYFLEVLLTKKYEEYGIIRCSRSFHTSRINPVYQDLHNAHLHLGLVFSDLHDANWLHRTFRTTQPDRIYDLGAKLHKSQL